MFGSRSFIAAIVLGGSLLVADHSTAQTDAATLSLIEKLKPSTATRGIRLPSSAPAAPAPAATAPSVAAPAGTIVTPIEPARPVAATTPAAAPAAAADAPSVSITVTFATGSAELTPEARRALAPLGRALSSADLAPYRFRIEGHTDTVGNPASNRLLSERRAAAVRDYLSASFSVDAARLELIGLGDTMLEVTTPPQTAEVRNRRVKIVNIGS